MSREWNSKMQGGCANGFALWNWRHQQQGTGLPALFAGNTGEITLELWNQINTKNGKWWEEEKVEVVPGVNLSSNWNDPNNLGHCSHVTGSLHWWGPYAGYQMLLILKPGPWKRAITTCHHGLQLRYVMDTRNKIPQPTWSSCGPRPCSYCFHKTIPRRRHPTNYSNLVCNSPAFPFISTSLTIICTTAAKKKMRPSALTWWMFQEVLQHGQVLWQLLFLTAHTAVRM